MIKWLKEQKLASMSLKIQIQPMRKKSEKTRKRFIIELTKQNKTINYSMTRAAVSILQLQSKLKKKISIMNIVKEKQTLWKSAMRKDIVMTKKMIALITMCQLGVWFLLLFDDLSNKYLVIILMIYSWNLILLKIISSY